MQVFERPLVPLGRLLRRLLERRQPQVMFNPGDPHVRY
ncbi:hypothetical protein VARIO8X_160181 [Burkholderiales bacterium 8X]|nr:hypothetical protein VARIO8X_160181 [Burkholderiales bacterium 8X]